MTGADQTITTDPGHRLEYVVTAETWWAPTLTGDRDHSINISKTGYDVPAWGFRIVDHSRTLNRPAVKVEMFNNAFPAFTDIAPFFAALAAEQPDTLDQVRVILDRLGFADTTERINSDPDRFARLQHTSQEGH